MKFKFIHKIFVIQEKILVFFNLLGGPVITCSGADRGRGLCIPEIQHASPSMLNSGAYNDCVYVESLPE